MDWKEKTALFTDMSTYVDWLKIKIKHGNCTHNKASVAILIYTLIQPICNTVLQFLTNIIIHLPYDWTILFLRFYPRKLKQMCAQRLALKLAISTLFVIAKIRKNINFYYALNR